MEHRAIGQVAEHFMNDDASSATRALLNGERLSEVANWADEIRHDPAWVWTKPLHFADPVEGSAHFELARDCHPTSGCVVSAILEEMDCLRSTTTTMASRAIALKLLIHFVGDIHQPLHIARASDKGGNLIHVKFDGTTTTLHALWDMDLMKRRYVTAEQLSSELINAITPELRAQWDTIDPEAWADCSYQYALHNAYAVPAGDIIDEAYEQRNVPIIRLRLAQAGVRLAAVLNTLFVPRGPDPFRTHLEGTAKNSDSDTTP